MKKTMSKTCPHSNVSCDNEVCDVDGFCERIKLENEYQRGYKDGLIVMREYIAKFLMEQSSPLATQVRIMRDPVFPTEGIHVTKTIEIKLGNNSGLWTDGNHDA